MANALDHKGSESSLKQDCDFSDYQGIFKKITRNRSCTEFMIRQILKVDKALELLTSCVIKDKHSFFKSLANGLFKRL